MSEDVKTLEKVIDLVIQEIDKLVRIGDYEKVRVLSETLVNLQLAHKHGWDAIYVSYKVLDFQNAVKQANLFFEQQIKKPDDDLPFGKAV